MNNIAEHKIKAPIINIVFLYTELAGYTLSCLSRLVEKGVGVHVFRWPLNKEAPFDFQIPTGVTVYDKTGFSRKELLNSVREINPQMIVCSGWVDKDYVHVCTQFKRKIPTVLSMDNHWEGKMKQNILVLLSNWMIHTKWSHVWVPGQPQKEYALKLGFPETRIRDGFYCADVISFSEIYNKRAMHFQGGNELPKKILYVGRYLKHKGIFELWSAFLDVSKSHQGWKLVCAGTGDEYENRIKDSNIEHLGFVQPSEMKNILKDVCAVVVPSHFEPWGVVVQEFAIAGIPLIVSDKVGAATRFVKEGENGFVYQSDDVGQLKQRLTQVMNLSFEEWKKMCDSSHRIGLDLTPEKWADNLLSIIGK